MHLFDFSKNEVTSMPLEVLKRTYLETNPITQEPIRGIHHYELIEKVCDIISQNNLSYEVREIFAAQNKDKNMPGVVVAPHIAEKFGKGSPESHCLRRVFTTLHITTDEHDETDTGLVIAYHQDGIQIAIGPNVKICHNQCILSPERYVANYGGKDKVKDFDKMFAIVDDWLKNFSEQRDLDLNTINRMKSISCDYRQVKELIGHLTINRVAYDNRIGTPQRYALNQGQISDFTHSYLNKYQKLIENNGDGVMSLWDIHNIGTEFYKPGMPIPNIIPQNLAWTETLKSFVY